MSGSSSISSRRTLMALSGPRPAHPDGLGPSFYSGRRLRSRPGTGGLVLVLLVLAFLLLRFEHLALGVELDLDGLLVLGDEEQLVGEVLQALAVGDLLRLLDLGL